MGKPTRVWIPRAFLQETNDGLNGGLVPIHFPVATDEKFSAHFDGFKLENLRKSVSCRIRSLFVLVIAVKKQLFCSAINVFSLLSARQTRFGASQANMSFESREIDSKVMQLL